MPTSKKAYCCQAPSVRRVFVPPFQNPVIARVPESVFAGRPLPVPELVQTVSGAEFPETCFRARVPVHVPI